MKLPNVEQAIVDIAKLRDYSLDAPMRKANTRPASLPPRSESGGTMRSGCARWCSRPPGATIACLG